MPDRIHVFSKFNDRVVGPLAEAFPGAEIVTLDDDAAFAAGLPDAEFLLALKPPRGHWAKAGKLRLLQSFGAGIDHLMPLDGLRRETVVCNAAGLAAGTMGEFALTLTLMLIKRMDWANTGHRASTWRQFMPGTAAGSTIGILGLGRIGESFAQKAGALGMRVIGTQRQPRDVPGVDKVVGADRTAEIVAESDVVVCILPLTDETRYVLDEPMMRRMKPGASLINLGRGGLVDEPALIRLLEEGHLSGAALDVFEQEPLPSDNPLWTAPNLIITPHVAGGFPDYMGGISRLFAENVRAFEAGEPMKTHVRDPSRGY